MEPFQALIPYTPYAVAFRYADASSGSEEIDREGVLALVETLLTGVEKELAEDAAGTRLDAATILRARDADRR